MSIKIGSVTHEADAEVMSLIDELHRDRERLQCRVSFLEGESEKDLKCLRSQAQRIALLEETLEDWKDMPCETKGLEDLEGGCCRACRVRFALTH